MRTAPAHAACRLAGLVAVYAAFEWSARALGSDRGQAGVPVAALVVASTMSIERLCFQPTWAAAAAALGLGVPARRGLLGALLVSGLLLAVIPLHGHLTSAAWALRSGWQALLVGLVAQAGIAEETLFRGYLFGHLRRHHTFWRAAALSMPPFVAVHLMMFVHLPWGVALTSLLLAATISFPLAWLFELGGRTIWAPALLHAVVQGALKVVVVTEASTTTLAWLWMAACAVIPWSVFVLRPGSTPSNYRTASTAASNR